MSNQFRNLTSIYSQIQWEKLSDKQKTSLKNQIKTKAAVLIIQATQCITNKNLQKAKQLLIYLADLFMLIKDPDQQIQKWMQITSSYAALLYKNEEIKLQRNKSNQKKSNQSEQNQLSLHYNKFSSQFELKIEESREQLLGLPGYQDVLHYVSKVNTILFGYQNAANNSPLYVMFFSYWVPFLLSVGFLALILIYLLSQNFLDQLGSTDFGLQIPLILIGSLFIIPMIMIIIKTPEQKNNLFFSKKLVQEIKQINLDCKNRGKRISFTLQSNGYQIIAKIEKQQLFSTNNYGNENQHEFMGKIQQLKQQISKASRKQLFIYQGTHQKTSRQEFIQAQESL